MSEICRSLLCRQFPVDTRSALFVQGAGPCWGAIIAANRSSLHAPLLLVSPLEERKGQRRKRVGYSQPTIRPLSHVTLFRLDPFQCPIAAHDLWRNNHPLPPFRYSSFCTAELYRSVGVAAIITPQQHQQIKGINAVDSCINLHWQSVGAANLDDKKIIIHQIFDLAIKDNAGIIFNDPSKEMDTYIWVKQLVKTQMAWLLPHFKYRDRTRQPLS
jgi:hypothetical protein